MAHTANSALIVDDDGSYRVMLRGLEHDVYLPDDLTSEQAHALRHTIETVFAKGQDIAQKRFMESLRRHFSEHTDG